MIYDIISNPQSCTTRASLMTLISVEDSPHTGFYASGKDTLSRFLQISTLYSQGDPLAALLDVRIAD